MTVRRLQRGGKKLNFGSCLLDIFLISAKVEKGVSAVPRGPYFIYSWRKMMNQIGISATDFIHVHAIQKIQRQANTYIK